ncbi:MBL fold metallo-hydrolase [Clostridium chrysemydis]|uniref:MBL fold metallo-hydrolase n=1 Tax=Clostridium chrysemydis TaxID=2665504 RepID=UPI001884178E|nr:MBL fold metallo-hydrolase [Clostridium chrysemydis]
MKIKITTLIENKEDNYNKLKNEHGLSLLIEAYGEKILFDTGKSGDFLDNAKDLNVDLENLGYVILSHGHYDHSGGFKRLAKSIDKKTNLLVSEEFFFKKYKKLDYGFKFNGNSFDRDFIFENNINIEFIKEDFNKISDKIYLFKNFKVLNDFEKIEDCFYLKKDNNFIRDDFKDEVALGIDTDKGIILVLGCAHIGIVNIIESVKRKTNKEIFAVFGGSHLVNASRVQILETIKYLKDKNIKILRLSHCTGDKVCSEFIREFKDRFKYNKTGDINDDLV